MCGSRVSEAPDEFFAEKIARNLRGRTLEERYRKNASR
jgi:hypothetical protein